MPEENAVLLFTALHPEFSRIFYSSAKVWTGLNRLKNAEIWNFTDGSHYDAQSIQNKPMSDQNPDKLCGLLEIIDPPTIKAANCDKQTEPLCMVECLQGTNDPIENSVEVTSTSGFQFYSLFLFTLSPPLFKQEIA